MTIDLSRRSFITGVAAALAVPVLPSIAYDPMVLGIRWQSWPLQSRRPDWGFATGTIGFQSETPTRSLSYYLERLDWYRKLYPDLGWEAVVAIHRANER